MSDDLAVARAAEQLRLAMIAPTHDNLLALLDPDLTYGHSNAKIDTRDSMMAAFLDGRSDFTTIDISEQVVKVVGDLAWLRHSLVADTNDSGKPGHVELKVLLVWRRAGDAWKLVARQAVKKPL
ncbi:nuclear transport factor 2 family protein [soil metagenome]